MTDHRDGYERATFSRQAHAVVDVLAELQQIVRESRSASASDGP